MMGNDEYTVDETHKILLRQLNSYWDVDDYDGFIDEIDVALKKTKRSFDNSSRSYYYSRGFSVLNTAVYSVFLYYLSHAIGGDIPSLQTNSTI